MMDQLLWRRQPVEMESANRLTDDIALAVLQRLLRVGKQRAREGAANPYCAQIEECNGVAELIAMQHQGDEAHGVALGAEILVEFFPQAVGLQE